MVTDLIRISARHIAPIRLAACCDHVDSLLATGGTSICRTQQRPAHKPLIAINSTRFSSSCSKAVLCGRHPNLNCFALFSVRKAGSRRLSARIRQEPKNDIDRATRGNCSGSSRDICQVILHLHSAAPIFPLFFR